MSKSYREDLLNRLQDPEYASEYLEAILIENDEKLLELALNDIKEAQEKNNL